MQPEHHHHLLIVRGLLKGRIAECSGILTVRKMDGENLRCATVEKVVRYESLRWALAGGPVLEAALVDAKPGDLRFQGLVRNPQLRGRTVWA
jgi:hypothetical protein